MNLAAVYRSAEREIKALLLGIDLEKFNGQDALNIQGRVLKIVAGLNVSAERWIDDDLMKSYHAGERRAKVALEILGRKPKKPATSDPRVKIKDDVYTTLYRSNRSILKTTETYLSVAMLAAGELRAAQVQEFDFGNEAAAIGAMSAEAVAAGSSRGVLKRLILAHLRALVTDGNLIEINGRNYKIGKYAEMVARTEIRKAQTEATKDLCKRYDNDLVEVSDHSTDCDECEPFEGNIYSLSGAHSSYPELPESPPFHPNCKHSLLPTSDEAVSAREAYQ